MIDTKRWRRWRDGEDTNYLLDPVTIKQSPPAFCKPSELRTSIRPNAYTAQNASLYSTKDVKEFWKRILLTKHSDEFLHALGNTISKEFFDPNEIDQPKENYLHSDWLNHMRIGTTNRMLTLNAFFSEDWFKSMFIQLFSYLTNFLTQGGILFATYQFMHFLVTTFIHVINALQILKKYLAKNRICNNPISFVNWHNVKTTNTFL